MMKSANSDTYEQLRDSYNSQIISGSIRENNLNFIKKKQHKWLCKIIIAILLWILVLVILLLYIDTDINTKFALISVYGIITLSCGTVYIKAQYHEGYNVDDYLPSISSDTSTTI
jgi:hypothetical protein